LKHHTGSSLKKGGLEMRRLLNKVDERHLKLLEVLWEGGWKTTEVLAGILHTSERTLRKDIQAINNYIDPLYIETSLKSGIYLHTQSRHSKSYIYSKILSESLEFSLIECSFLEKFNDLHELCEMNFISEETTKKMIRKLNPILKEEQIYFDAAGRLCGSEIVLRQFMVRYMLEKYEHVSHICTEKQFLLLEELITRFLQENPEMTKKESADYSMMKKLKMSVYLSIKRLKKNHLIQEEQIEKPIKTNFLEDSRLLEGFAEHYDFVLTKSGIKDLFYPFFEPFYVTNYKELLQLADKELLLNPILAGLAKLIYELEKKFTIECFDKEQLIFKLYQSIAVNQGPSFIIYDKNHDFFVGLSAEYNFVIEFLEQKIKETLQGKFIAARSNQFMVRQVIFELLTSWGGLFAQIEYFMPKIHACLFIDSTKEHIEFIKEKLEYHLYPRFVLEISPAISTRELINQSKKYDCIITNLSHLELNEIPVICISNYINAIEADHLINFYKNKVKTTNIFLKRR
jgi:hypothetical protein